MSTAKEEFLASLFARERLDLSYLQRKRDMLSSSSSSRHNSNEDLIAPFTAPTPSSSSISSSNHVVHIRDIVMSSGNKRSTSSQAPLRPFEMDVNHFVFAVPTPEVPIVLNATNSLSIPSKQQLQVGDKKRKRGAIASSSSVVQTEVVVKQQQRKKAAGGVGGGGSGKKEGKRKKGEEEEEASLSYLSYLSSTATTSIYRDPLAPTIPSIPSSSKSSSLREIYAVIAELFQRLWSLQFSDPTVSAAFFARIDSRNCVDYNLPDFAHKACSLPVIKVSCYSPHLL